MSVRDKIKNRLDTLETGLLAGRHLAGDEGKAEMTALVDSVAKFFTILDDGDRDFVNAARQAIDEKISWK